MSKVEIRRNHEWYGQWSLAQLLELYAKFTVQRVLERDDFAKRMQAGGELSMLELSYPMLQGFDSFELHADVELGGSDQLFNMLMGRKVQKRLGQEPQDVMAVPLIEGTDGVRKMSKSYDNYIALNTTPADMFGKLMSVPDEFIGKYLELVTRLGEEEIKEIMNQKAGGDPRGAKVAMAKAVTASIHGEEAAAAAAERFDNVHAKGQTPEDISEYPVGEGATLKAALVGSGLASSGSEAQRLIEQGAVKVDGKVAAGISEPVQPGQVIQVGPHRFLRLT
jgi:tyrosyl-tRNA synthetase